MTPTDTFAIDGELSIYRAGELREALLARLAEAVAHPLEIDLAGVTEFDSAGVQLLFAARKSAAARGRELRLVRHSPAVLEVFQALDLAGHFGNAPNLPAAR
ncbi:anti-sigma B factor antagonist [Rubrivivax gelatinosus]|uniref:Anti-sigma B factor antagonist n=1 Tax=Rubrivivax gelatinosus TaxID=28068 RepID=A0ABS1DRN4_RUBGE|nr:STAS domain-containing protein [Rubrivivax gelatinosus]MBK1614745.1 anti-sigma B factor antagonist [Rubrivivax gelatinosus]MBK1711845.1 anti-sigma B factor antagonist [Rubrivivax gelatinosus]